MGMVLRLPWNAHGPEISLESVAHFHGSVWYTQGMMRKDYASDIVEDQWASMAPYPTLMRQDAPQPEHLVREGFIGIR